MPIKSFDAKLGNMRKPQHFVVYPRQDAAAPIIIQSDKSIGQFDPVTGVGVLNTKGSGYKGFLHLAKWMGAVDFTLPPEVLKTATETGAVTADGTVSLTGP
jgi:hypothetical protein